MADSGLTRVPRYYGLLWLGFLMFLRIFHELLIYIHNQCLATSTVIAKPLRARSGTLPPLRIDGCTMFRSSHPASKGLSIPPIESTSLLVGARNQQLFGQESPSNLYPTCTACLVPVYESASYMSGQPRYRSQPAHMICVLNLQSNHDLFRICAW